MLEKDLENLNGRGIKNQFESSNKNVFITRYVIT